jgi:hypothetical protein
MLGDPLFREAIFVLHLLMMIRWQPFPFHCRRSSLLSGDLRSRGKEHTTRGTASCQLSKGKCVTASFRNGCLPVGKLVLY